MFPSTLAACGLRVDGGLQARLAVQPRSENSDQAVCITTPLCIMGTAKSDPREDMEEWIFGVQSIKIISIHPSIHTFKGFSLGLGA